MAADSEGVSAVMGEGWHGLGGGKEEGDRGRDGLGVVVGVRVRLKRGLGRRGRVKGSERVEWSGVGWVVIVTPLE